MLLPSPLVNRRTFLVASAAGLLTPALSRLLAAEPDKRLVELFDSSDPAVLKLTAEVYAKCILGKVFPPEDPLKHNWIGP